jgi:hypothetical protein
MKNILWIICILFLPLAGKTQPKTFKSAIAYNDYIVEEQKKIGAAIAVFTNSVGDTTFSKEIKQQESNTEQKRLLLVQQCKTSVNNIKGLPAYGGNTKFKNASINLFNFYLSTAENEYKKMAAILYSATYDEAALNTLMDAVTSQEKIRDEEFQKAEQDFAKANKFTLQ